ncbi:integrase [Gossypium australe]|uniref:Integrase n=1 Tax=Gossypium australe TaxID=47621 RepID=A0A5B6WVA4_9ROSI|nr:integrase [Gossypium australe]
MLNQEPILFQPESRKDYVVYSDASNIGLGWVLMQNSKRWIKLLKDFYCTIEYHLEKANVVADALNRRLMIDLREMFARISLYKDGGLLAELQVNPTLPLDVSLLYWVKQVKKGRYYVPNDKDLKQSILWKAHSSPCAMHPEGNNMYRDLRELYWWLDLH